MGEITTFLTLPDRKLAYQLEPPDPKRQPKTPIVFFGGFASDMTGTKASFLAEKCALAGRGLLRFDYRGHGRSSGEFIDGTIGDWLQDALAVFDALTEGPQILAGSSMGGWIALLVARARPERVAGFVGVAAAPDFTEDLVVPSLTAEQREQLEREGFYYDQDAPSVRRVPITQRLIDEAKGRLVLREPLRIGGPVRLLQGMQDKDVPWRHALKIAEHLGDEDVSVTLVKDGDHSLSREQDLAMLWETVDSIG